MNEETAARLLTTLSATSGKKLDKVAINWWMEELLKLDAFHARTAVGECLRKYEWFPSWPKFQEVYDASVRRAKNWPTDALGLPTRPTDRPTTPEEAKRHLAEMSEMVSLIGTKPLICVRHAPKAREKEYALRMAERDRKHYLTCAWCRAVEVDLDAIKEAHNHTGETWQECEHCRAEWTHLLPTEPSDLPACPKCESAFVTQVEPIDGCGYYCATCDLLYEGSVAERDRYRYGTGQPRKPGLAQT